MKYYCQGEIGFALRAPHEQRSLEMLRAFLHDCLQAEENCDCGDGAEPDFQKDHGSTPARKATQRNHTHATARPLPNAQRLPLMM